MFIAAMNAKRELPASSTIESLAGVNYRGDKRARGVATTIRKHRLKLPAPATIDARIVLYNIKVSVPTLARQRGARFSL